MEKKNSGVGMDTIPLSPPVTAYHSKIIVQMIWEKASVNKAK